MEEITYGEMLEMAKLGAGVMQPRAVEWAVGLTFLFMYVRLFRNKRNNDTGGLFYGSKAIPYSRCGGR